MTAWGWLLLLLGVAYLGVGCWCADQFGKAVRRELARDLTVISNRELVLTALRTAALIFTWLPELIFWSVRPVFHRGH